tara:strand:- start:279 stop:473 length:195 start_codon:yes stop_codon:yes gene_type:complete
MVNRCEILDEIMLYILKRAKCEKDIDKYLLHVLNYCKNDFRQASKRQKENNITIDEIEENQEHK